MTLSWDGLRGEAFPRLEVSTKGRGTLLHCTGSAPRSSSSREIIINSPSQRHTAVRFCLARSDALQRPVPVERTSLKRKYTCLFKQIFRQLLTPSVWPRSLWNFMYNSYHFLHREIHLNNYLWTNIVKQWYFYFNNKLSLRLQCIVEWVIHFK